MNFLPGGFVQLVLLQSFKVKIGYRDGRFKFVGYGHHKILLLLLHAELPAYRPVTVSGAN